MSKLVLIDGNAILHRAYHALPRLTNKKQEPTNAIYGFVAVLLKVIKEFQPSHLAACFDLPGPTFRNELYKKYQSHRPKMEDDLSSQIGKVQQLLKTMQIPIFTQPGYEADDVIGSITKQAKKKLAEVVILTGDKDLMQLVDKRVKLFMPVQGLTKGKIFDQTAVLKKMGVKASQIVDYKALVGDASDNYPGVSGIGPKTAVDLLTRYNNLDSIYRHLDELKTNLAQKLVQNKTEAYLSFKLAKIIDELEIELNLQKLKLPDLATKEVIKAFGDLGFKTLLKRLMTMEKSPPSVTSHQSPAKKDQDQLGLF